MAIVYSGTYNNGIILNSAAQNPATIAATGYVGNSGAYPSYNGDAIFGAAGTAWNVINHGTIVSGSGYYASFSAGIRLLSGGTVSNGSTGSIAGRRDGIWIEGGSGTVANSGTITASTVSGVYLFA